MHPINKNEILCKMKKKRIKKEFLEKGKFNRLTGIQIEELFQREKVEERKKIIKHIKKIESRGSNT